MLAPLTWLSKMLRPRYETVALQKRAYEKKLREAGHSRAEAKRLTAERLKHDAR